MWSRLLACLCALAACQGPSQVASSSFGTSITTAPPAASSSGTTGDPMSSSSSSSTTSTGSGEDSAASVAGSTTLILDVGTEQDVESPQPVGCKGKIDFLFVISRDGTLLQHQAKLFAAFPEFIATIEAKFADFDYHIMVVDADRPGYWGSSWCERR